MPYGRCSIIYYMHLGMLWYKIYLALSIYYDVDSSFLFLGYILSVSQAILKIITTHTA